MLRLTCRQIQGIIAVDLDTGEMVKRLAGNDVVKADPTFVGIYDGQPIYCWNGTQRNFCNTASDGIALQSGNVYWGVLASRRFYYISQAIMQNFSATDDEVLAAVQDPGQMGSEQAGFTADDQGRLFMLASEVSLPFEHVKIMETNSRNPAAKFDRVRTNAAKPSHRRSERRGCRRMRPGGTTELCRENAGTVWAHSTCRQRSHPRWLPLLL